MQEAIVTIIILGILAAIAIVIFLGLLERWRVEAAANQLVADMRLAHTKATNRLTEWRMILAPDTDDEGVGADYYLIRADNSDCVQRFFPANVEIENHNAALNDDPAIGPACASPNPARTRKVEFNTNGTLAFTAGPSGSACVTVDGNPKLRVVALTSTSRVRIQDRSGVSCVP